jgi:hypothetical protein
MFAWIVLVIAATLLWQKSKKGKACLALGLAFMQLVGPIRSTDWGRGHPNWMVVFWCIGFLLGAIGYALPWELGDEGSQNRQPGPGPSA